MYQPGEFELPLIVNHEGGHVAKVTCLVNMPDGLLLSGSEDGTAKIWHIAERICQKTLFCDDRQPILSLALTDNGRIIAGCKNNLIRIWNIETGEMESVLAEHRSPVTCLIIIKRDTKEWLLSGSEDGTIKTWDMAANYVCRQTFVTPGLNCFANNLKDVLLWVGYKNGMIASYDIFTGSRISAFQVPPWKKSVNNEWISHASIVIALYFNREGKLYSGLSNRIEIWDVRRSQVDKTFNYRGITIVDFVIREEDGKLIAAYSTGEIKIWDIETVKLQPTTFASIPNRNPQCLLLSSDRQQVIWGASDSTLNLIDLTEGSGAEFYAASPAKVEWFAITPDNKTLLSYSSDQLIRKWNVVTGTCLLTFGRPTANGKVSKLVLSSDGRILYTNTNGSIIIWDVLTGREREPFFSGAESSNKYRSLTISHDGDKLFAVINNGLMAVIDIASKRKQTIRLDTRPDVTKTSVRCVIDMGEHFTLAGCADGTLRFYGGNYPAKNGIIKAHEKAVSALAMDRRDGTIISGSDDTTIKIWQIAKECRHEHRGARIVSTNEPVATPIYSIINSRCIGTLSGHTDAIMAFILVEAQGILFSLSSDNTIKIWNLRTQTCLTTIHGHTHKFQSMAMSCDSQLLFVAVTNWLQYYDIRSLKIAPRLDVEPLPIDSIIQQCQPYGSRNIALLAPIAMALGRAISPTRAAATAIPAASIAAIPMLPMAAAAAAATVSARPRPPSRQLLIIPSEDISKSIKLGEGSYGVVYRGTWGDTPVAFKELKSPEISRDMQEEFEREARIHGQLSHPHIVILYGVAYEPPRYSLVLELTTGSLRKWLAAMTRALPESEQTRLAHEIAQGLNYLHSCGIIHRDLKSANVLLDACNTAKLSDFGLARVKGETGSQTKMAAGTAGWIAPELSLDEPYSTSSDVYAYGMTLWEICSRQIPFAKEGNQVVVATRVATRGLRETIPSDAPQVLREIIGTATTGCWAAEPANRHTLSHILQLLRDYRAAQGQPLDVADAVVGAVAAVAVEDRAADSMPAPHGGHTMT
jgi:WD40 repeat protein